jgi:capsular polysaccharide biosynthesis protein
MFGHWARRLAFPLRLLPGSSKKWGPPRGIHVTLAGIPEALGRPAAQSVVLLPKMTVDRQLPVTNSQLVTRAFERYQRAEYTECSVTTLAGGRFSGRGEGGIVISHDDKVVRPFSPPRNENDPRFHNALSTFRFPPVVHLQRAIVVSTRCAHNNYSHWMLDHMTRFWSLSRTERSGGEVTLIVTGGQTRYQQYMLSRLAEAGLRFSSVLSVHPQLHIEAESLVLPSYLNPSLNMNAYGHGAQQLRFVADLVESKPAKQKAIKRLFISRAKARRTVEAEPAIIRLLALLGFEAVCLEDYTVPEQATLFREAEVVVGFHGAGFTNLIFSAPGTVVIEIFSPDFIVTNFWSLCHDLKLRYFAFCDDSELQGIISYGQAQAAPIRVSAERVAEFVRSCVE